MKVERLGFEHEARRRVMGVEKRRYQTPLLPALWSLLKMSYGVAFQWVRGGVNRNEIPENSARVLIR